MSKRMVFGLAAVVLLAAACRAASMIPVTGPVGLPVFEQDDDSVISSVESGEASTLFSRIKEDDEGEMLEPGTQHYTVDLHSSDKVDLSTGWCAKSKTILEDNETHWTGNISVDGYVIPEDQLVAFESNVAAGDSTDYPDGLACYSWDILASNWPVGAHRVVESWTLDLGLNDGYSDYEAGSYAIEYIVNVSE